MMRLTLNAMHKPHHRRTVHDQGTCEAEWLPTSLKPVEVCCKIRMTAETFLRSADCDRPSSPVIPFLIPSLTASSEFRTLSFFNFTCTKYFN